MVSYPETSFDPFFVNDLIFFCADPSSVELNIDGSTDKCSKGEDINFIFTGFTLSGKVSFVPFNSLFSNVNGLLYQERFLRSLNLLPFIW